LPFQGGHYRLSARRYGPREHSPISPDGEIHLGPGWQLLEHGALVAAAGTRYRANASHNAGILYHEYAHHLTRHTADFRANALVAPERQSNRKSAIDEGTCDYWAAVMLGSPHIWAWHRRHDAGEIHPRSLASSKTMADYDPARRADPHGNGTIWGAALWSLRCRLGSLEADGARHFDRVLMAALLLLGRLAGPSRGATRRARSSFSAGLSALLRADELVSGSRHRELILETFRERGVSAGAEVREAVLG